MTVPDRTDSDREEILSGNLAALDEELLSVWERRHAHLSETALLLAEGAEPGEPFYRSQSFSERYGELTRKRRVLHYEPIPENRRLLASRSHALSLQDRVELCRALHSLLAPPSDPLFYCPGDPDEGAVRIAYIRNSYANTAYRRFSEYLTEPTSHYSEDFVGVCEDVYDGRVQMCILPIENTSDGVLTGFRNLIAKYDLKIALTCDVPMSDGEGFTRFALLRRTIGRIPVKEYDGTLRFAFSLPFSENEEEAGGDGSLPIVDILSAADSLGLSLCRIDSVPSPYADGATSCEIVLSATEETLPPFLCFLNLEVPRFTPTGLYFILS